MSRPEPLTALLTPGRVLSTADVERLRPLLPRSARQTARLDERDAAIREAYTVLGIAEMKPAARRIEVELGRWLVSGWRIEAAGGEPRPETQDFPGAIRRLARVMCGKPLGIKQIVNIISGNRSPRK